MSVCDHQQLLGFAPLLCAIDLSALLCLLFFGVLCVADTLFQPVGMFLVSTYIGDLGLGLSVLLINSSWVVSLHLKVDLDLNSVFVDFLLFGLLTLCL